MPSKRERVLAALFAQLETGLSATVRRNEALAERMPAEGLVILRDGDPGEPDVTLNPRTEFFSHRVELQVLLTRTPDGGGEAALDLLLEDIAAALATDLSLGGLAENLRLGAPETGTLEDQVLISLIAPRPHRLALDTKHVREREPAYRHWVAGPQDVYERCDVSRLFSVRLGTAFSSTPESPAWRDTLNWLKDEL